MLPGWIRFFRLTFGILAIISVFKNYIDLAEPHFWHFFTNQSSFVSGVVLLLGATLFSRQRSPLAWDIVRGTAVMMMLMTGIVYAALLGGLYNPFNGEHPWPSSVMHQLLPIVMLLDLLIVPLHRSVPTWSMSLFTVYPLAWLGFTVWYGTGAGWYPYEFLDPALGGGVTGVAVTIAAIVVGFLAIAAFLLRLSRAMRTNRSIEPVPRRLR
jgi:hypothetical protein